MALRCARERTISLRRFTRLYDLHVTARAGSIHAMLSRYEPDNLQNRVLQKSTFSRAKVLFQRFRDMAANCTFRLRKGILFSVSRRTSQNWGMGSTFEIRFDAWRRLWFFGWLIWLPWWCLCGPHWFLYRRHAISRSVCRNVKKYIKQRVTYFMNCIIPIRNQSCSVQIARRSS